MKAKVLLIAVCLSLFSAHLLWGAQEFAGGIVYGQEHAFSLVAPPGWVLDNQSGVEQGFDAVFYPKGSSWSEAPAVMYGGMANKKKEGATTIQGIIDNDVAKFKQKNSQIVITEGRPLKTADGKTAQVRLFRGDRWGNQEAVAYIDEPAVVAFLVLSSRNQADFQKALPAFEKLVASYRALKVDVKNPKSQKGENQAPR